MIKNDTQGNEYASSYMDAVNDQYAGVMMSTSKQVEIARNAITAGVPRSAVDTWVESRPSFEADKLDPSVFTEKSGARYAGFFEQFKTFSFTDEERNKLAEQGVQFPSPLELGGQIVGEAALAGAQLASMTNPIIASMTLEQIGAAAANQAAKVFVGSSANQMIQSLTSGRDFNANRAFADAFDAGSLSILPAFSTSIVKGKIAKTIANGVTSSIYGMGEYAVSSQIRGTEMNAGGFAASGGLAGLAGAAIGYSNVATKELELINKNVKVLADAGITAPPIGLIDPTYSAKLRAASESSEPVRNELDKIFGSLKNSITNKTGGFGKLSEPAVLTRGLAKVTGKIPEMQGKVDAASEATAKAALELSGKKAELGSAFAKEASKIKERNYNSALSSVIATTNAAIDGFVNTFSTQKFKEALNGGTLSLTAAQARQNVKAISSKAYDAFKSTSSALFDAVPEGSFDSAAINNAIKGNTELATATSSDTIKAALRNIPQKVEEDGTITYLNASKQQWLNVKNALNDAIGANARAPSPDDHWIGKAITSIMDEMNAQKVVALGEEGALKWDEARNFYRGIEAFHETDTRLLLFGSNENTPLAKTLIADISQNGIGPESRYGKIIKSLKVNGNVSLFKQQEAYLNDTLKSYVVDVSTAPDGTLSPRMFVKAIGDMRRRPDALKTLGFGDTKTINFLEQSLEKFPDASRLTPEQFNTLLSFAGAPASIKKLQPILQDLATQHADSKIGKAVAFEAMGNLAEARRAIYEARQAVKAAGLKEARLNDALIIARNNPVYQNFSTVNVRPDSYDMLYETFFNPISGKLSNQDVRLLLTTLATGNKGQQQLAAAMRARFLNDAVMKAKNVTRTNEEALGLFAESLTPSKDPASFYARAQAIFSPEQLGLMQRDYRAAKVIEAYRQNADVANRNMANVASVTAPIVGNVGNITTKGSSLGSTLRGAGGLISDGKYQLVNFAYSFNPELYIKTKNAVALATGYFGELNPAQKYQFIMQNSDVYNEINPDGQEQQPVPPR